MSARWKGGWPRKGWSFLYEEDLGNIYGECELCGSSIRYSCVLVHPDMQASIRIGRVCAAHLTQPYVASERRAASEADSA